MFGSSRAKRMVQDGDRQVKLKAGHELALNNASLKTAKFDEAEYQSTDLYRFSNLRSQYLAEANVDAAGLYYPGGRDGTARDGIGIRASSPTRGFRETA